MAYKGGGAGNAGEGSLRVPRGGALPLSPTWARLAAAGAILMLAAGCGIAPPTPEQEMQRMRATLSVLQALRAPSDAQTGETRLEGVIERQRVTEEAVREILALLRDLHQQSLMDRRRLDDHEKRLWPLEGRKE